MHLTETYDDEQLLQFLKGDEISNFLVKGDWANNAVSVIYWKGFKRQNTKLEYFSDHDLLSSALLGDKLLILTRGREELELMMIDSGLKQCSNVKLPRQEGTMGMVDVEWFANPKFNRIYLLISGYLKEIQADGDSLSIRNIDENIESACYFPNGTAFAFIRAFDSYHQLLISFSDGKKEIFSFPVYNAYRLKAMPDGQLAVFASNSNLSTDVYIVNQKKGVYLKETVESDINTIDIRQTNGDINLLYINQGEGIFKIIEKVISYKTYTRKEVEVPGGLFEPISLSFASGRLYALFRNGILVIDDKMVLTSSDFYSIGKSFNKKPEIMTYRNFVVLTSFGSSLIFRSDSNIFWQLNLFYKDTGKIIIPLALILLLLVIIQLYRHQRRLLNEILSLPTAGAIMVIDKNGRLDKANSVAKSFFGIAESVKMKKPFGTYLLEDGFKPVRTIIENGLSNKETTKIKANLLVGNQTKEWYCTVVPVSNIAGNFRGLVFTGVDITEPLERQRLSNWAQLAHDMQTNLSTIKLNAELLGDDDMKGNTERKGKILHQVNLLIQRVRDLVTVGRGDTIVMANAPIGEICLEARSEFDSVMFPDVEFVLETENFGILCDRAKIARAIRNAIENAIKSLPERKGKISLKTWRDGRTAYISIKDTGSGMDEQTRKKILQPYFTTSGGKGGSGIGTMIMQQVLELHGGSISIQSEKGQGTEIIFMLPQSSLKTTGKTKD